MELTARQLEIIEMALSYMRSNLDDVNSAFDPTFPVGEAELEVLQNKVSCF